MKFEFDPNKSRINKQKHGIDFVEAQTLWESLVLEIPVFTTDEPRWLVIGKVDKTFWTAVITHRYKSTIRIISVRRSRKEEKALYEKEDQKRN